MGNQRTKIFVTFYRGSHQQLRKKGTDMLSSLRHPDESRKGRRQCLSLLLSAKAISFFLFNKLRYQMTVESTFRRRILALAFQNLFHGVEKFFRLWVVRNLSKLEVNRYKMEMKKTNFKRNVRAFLSAISSLHTTARILAILANLLCLYGSSVWFLYGASVKYWGPLIKSVWTRHFSQITTTTLSKYALKYGRSQVRNFLGF